MGMTKNFKCECSGKHKELVLVKLLPSPAVLNLSTNCTKNSLGMVATNQQVFRPKN